MLDAILNTYQRYYYTIDQYFIVLHELIIEYKAAIKFYFFETDCRK